MIRSIFNRGVLTRSPSWAFNPSFASISQRSAIIPLTHSVRFSHNGNQEGGDQSTVAKSSVFREIDTSTGKPVYEESSTAKLHEIQSAYDRASQEDPQLKNEREWKEWYSVRDFGFAMGLLAFGCWLIPYLINQEHDHMLHDTTKQEADGLPFVIPREGHTGSGWWPGRHCQFFDGNCFAQVYAEADRMLKELEEGKSSDHH